MPALFGFRRCCAPSSIFVRSFWSLTPPSPSSAIHRCSNSTSRHLFRSSRLQDVRYCSIRVRLSTAQDGIFQNQCRFFSDEKSPPPGKEGSESASEGSAVTSDKEQKQQQNQHETILTEVVTEDDEEDRQESSENAEASGLDVSKFTHEVPIRMPDMGEGKGKIVKWFKKEGDVIKRKDILCDIETPDFTFGMETDDEADSIMGKILVPEGSDPVDDETVICIVLHKENDKSKKKK